MVGKITLVKSILLAVPNFFMSTMLVSISICNEIEKMSHKFIWGTCSEVRKSTLLSWRDYCKPLDVRGLSLRSLDDQNKLFC